ncbi:head completion adaptor [Vibrio phage 1.215.B._10N.222.54.F7]|nr:head completion adaptor [Vibrio phage 1.215.A._10N.222.54.F7]AUR96096.1 head completion adaptor [Vibrio phage 1.215.B._10N.222.54.F7]
MILASVAELRTRLNVSDKPVYNRVLTDILTNVTLGIETHLDTKFTRKEHKDVFFAGSNNYLVTGAPGRVVNGSPGVLYLLLSGLNVSNLTLSIGTTFSGSGSATNDYKLEERGIASLFNGWMPDDYITAVYQGGYETIDEETIPVYQGVPTLIKQAALMFAEHVYMLKYGDSQLDGSLPAGEDYTDPPNAVIQILYQYNRTAPHALRSLV